MKRTRPTLNLLNEGGKQKYLSGPPLLPSELCQKLNKQGSPFHQHFDVLLVPVGDDDEKKQCVLRCTCKASGMFPLMAKAAVRLLAVVTSAAAEWNWSAWGRVYQGTQPARH